MPTPAGKPCPGPAGYHRRRPERTLLYRLVQAHLATWLALHDDGQGQSAPALTESEFRRYLDWKHMGSVPNGDALNQMQRYAGKRDGRGGASQCPVYVDAISINWPATV